MLKKLKNWKKRRNIEQSLAKFSKVKQSWEDMSKAYKIQSTLSKIKQGEVK